MVVILFCLIFHSALWIGSASADEYFNDSIETYEKGLESLPVSDSNEIKEQIALRLNEQGLKKVMLLAMKFNSTVPGSRTVIIPADFYKFTLKKESLLANPVVQILNDISNLNLQENLSFYLKTSKIKIDGLLDEKSIKLKMNNTHTNGFDLDLSFSLLEVVVTGDSISLCEDRIRNKCGNGLKFTVSKYAIKSTSNSIKLVAKMRVTNKDNFAKVNILSVKTNLDTENAPELDIDMEGVTIPPVKIVINDQETQIDTAGLRDRVIEQKKFLGKKLMAFAAEFMANDFAKMINIYLVNNQVPTSWEIFSKTLQPYKELNFNEEIYKSTQKASPRYSRPEIDFKATKEPFVSPSDNTYVRPAIIAPMPIDYMKVIMGQVEQVITQAQANITLSSIKTPHNKDIELGANLNFTLNNRDFMVNNTLGNNASRKLPSLNLEPYRKNDINLVISEPLINGALDLITSTGLQQDILRAVQNIPEFSLDNTNAIRLHFTNRKSVVAVLNAAIDLKKLRGTFMENPLKWAKNKFAKMVMETANSTSVLKFPIEFEIVPTIRPEKCVISNKNSQVEPLIPQSSDSDNFKLNPNINVADNTYVRQPVTNRVQAEVDAWNRINQECFSFKIKSPFSGDNLINTFGYPSNVISMTSSNVNSMTNIVRKGVIEELKDSMRSIIDKDYPVDLKKVMNDSGVIFMPKSIIFDQAAYMIINLDIVDIKFDSMNPNVR